jgi:hypothetical protein
VSLAFLVADDLSRLLTKHVALRTSYNIEITPHKHTIQIATKSNNTSKLKRVGLTF